MVSKKMKTIRDLHKETLDAQKMMTRAMQDSAINMLDKKNKAFLAGRPLFENDADEENVTEERVRKAARKKKRMVLKKKSLSKAEASAEMDQEPVHEDAQSTARTTSKLNIARLPTLKVDKFCETLKTVIAKYGWVKEFTTENVMLGGKRHTYVYAGFGSKAAAGEFKREIDGEVVEGRKLLMKFV